MSKPSNFGPSFDVEDALGGFLDLAGKILLGAGLFAVVVAAGFLTFYVFTFSAGASGVNEAQALSNVELFSKLLVAGAVASAVGSTYLFWGEETLSAIQLVIAGIMWFAPFYLPAMASGSHSKVGGEALLALQKGGTVLGILALGALLTELALRVKLRMQQGSRADQLKYGKGIKEEKDIRNVFMGKCWQLPYCRKFVRERCPIFHAKRTCWKERVGCMCEEEVIRNAMENRTIPRDAVAAAKYIPVNNKITGAQKRERCRQCVIFNEHLKHQYRLCLPLLIIGYTLMAILSWPALQSGANGLLGKLDDVFKRFSLNQSASIQGQLGVSLGMFQTIFLICFLVVFLAYALKMLEYVIFKLKV